MATSWIQTRESKFTTREDGNQKWIEGYFAVFDSDYDIAPGMSESVDPHAFDRSLGEDDIRALINHDTTLVLGRTNASTLTLRTDNHGLYGLILVNPNDQDAMNGFSRVQRGDVSQCSIGFEIRKEDADIRDDGSVHWTLRDVKLYEVSICTFPAYSSTHVSARSAERAKLEERKFTAWKAKLGAEHAWLKEKGE